MVQKLFGEVAFELGFVNTDQLYQALTLQAKAEAEKKPYRSLGQILIELGHMNDKRVLEVLNVLHRGGSRRVVVARKKKE